MRIEIANDRGDVVFRLPGGRSPGREREISDHAIRLTGGSWDALEPLIRAVQGEVARAIETTMIEISSGDSRPCNP